LFWLIVNEIIDPFFKNLLCEMFNYGLEISHLVLFQRSFPFSIAKSYFIDFTIVYDEFGSALTILIFAVDMNRLVFIGVKKNHKSKIFVNFGMFLF